MDGDIQIESEEGRGSTFIVSVALPDARAAERLEVTAAVAPSAAPTTPLRILVVEDVFINQDIIRAVLEKASHVVDVVSDGADAIAAVQSTRYDIVLMDVQMPGMDGITATQRIRALAHPAKSVPIIAMTANVLPRQISQFRSAGMDDHVGKPFKREELHAAIERWAPRDR